MVVLVYVLLYLQMVAALAVLAAFLGAISFLLIPEVSALKFTILTSGLGLVLGVYVAEKIRKHVGVFSSIGMVLAVRGRSKALKVNTG
jgi:hypothetical protein